MPYMRFIKENRKEFARAKFVTYSENFVVCSTGRQVKIFDKNLHLLQTVKEVQYIYKCIISPDEQNLLLVSNANYFYIVSLKTFQVSRNMIKGKYSSNLEGQGCWSLNGKGCLFCVLCDKNVLSALRVYDNVETGEFQELLSDRYWLTSISVVRPQNKYLLTGYNRENNKSYLIWYDGYCFEEFPIAGLSEFDTAVRAQYDEENNWCIVFGTDSTIVSSIDGKLIHSVDLPQNSLVEFSFSDVFNNVSMCIENRKTITDLSSQAGLENLCIPDTILDMCYSKTGHYCYVATLKSLLCINIQTHQVEATQNFRYGVRRIQKINEDLLLVTTWDSIELIRITFDD